MLRVELADAVVEMVVKWLSDERLGGSRRRTESTPEITAEYLATLVDPAPTFPCAGHCLHSGLPDRTGGPPVERPSDTNERGAAVLPRDS